MSVADLMGQRGVFSLEVFPPKTDAGMERLCGGGGVLERLYALNPDYISCTYSPGGADAGRNLEVLDKILEDGRTTAVTHFTRAGNTREAILSQLRNYLDHGVNHMLIQDESSFQSRTAPGGGPQSASGLVKLAREEFGCRFTIAAAGSPDGFLDEISSKTDIAALKRAQENGADFILTQPCWDMDQFRRWLDALRAAGVWLNVEAGVLPIVDPAETIRMAASRNGRVLPRDLSGLLSRNWIYPSPLAKDPFDSEAEDKRASFKAAGIEYTLNQIRQYRACGVSGIHLHTGNECGDALYIAREAGLASGI